MDLPLYNRAKEQTHDHTGDRNARTASHRASLSHEASTTECRHRRRLRSHTATWSPMWTSSGAIPVTLPIIRTPLVQLHDRHHVGNLAGERLDGHLRDDGVGVDRPIAGGLLPPRTRAAHDAERPRVVLAVAAMRASLDQQLTTGTGREVGRGDRVGARPRPAAGSIADDLSVAGSCVGARPVPRVRPRADNWSEP